MASEQDDAQPQKRRRTVEETVTLYSYWRSSSSWRVRIALNWKQVPYKYKAVHLVKNEQFGDEYVAMNKMKVRARCTGRGPRAGARRHCLPSRPDCARAGRSGRGPEGPHPLSVGPWRDADRRRCAGRAQQVPTLVVGDAVMTQSSAILEFLEEEYPDRPLLPRGRVERAAVREVAAMIGCDTQPVQNLRVLRKVMEWSPEEEKEERKKAWGKHFIGLGLGAVERRVKETAGKYCVGDDVTLADLYLVPQLYNAARFGVDMDAFPMLKRVAEALAALPEFQKAHPSEQPDQF